MSIFRPTDVDLVAKKLCDLIYSYDREDEKEFIKQYPQESINFSRDVKQNIFNYAVIIGHFRICQYLIDNATIILNFDRNKFAEQIQSFVKVQPKSDRAKRYYNYILGLSDNDFIQARQILCPPMELITQKVEQQKQDLQDCLLKKNVARSETSSSEQQDMHKCPYP